MTFRSAPWTAGGCIRRRMLQRILRLICRAAAEAGVRASLNLPIVTRAKNPRPTDCVQMHGFAYLPESPENHYHPAKLGD
jgi:hypothetical protein